MDMVYNHDECEHGDYEHGDYEHGDYEHGCYIQYAFSKEMQEVKRNGRSLYIIQERMGSLPFDSKRLPSGFH